MADDKSYPKIPGISWWALRSQFQKSLPATVTKPYLISTLKVSDASANALILGLRRVGLLDEEDKTTARANDWRIDAKYSEVCKAIRDEIYPQDLRDAFPDGSDKAGIKQWFSHTTQSGDVSSRQMTSMYVLLTEAEAKALGEKKPKANGKKANKAQPVKTCPEVNDNDSTSPAAIPVVPVANAAPSQQFPSLHIDLQIHIAPDASTDQIDAIFASMAKHLYK